MTLSFSNKRPISIAIDISAVTRYARLMDPRLSLRRTPCFVPSLSRTLIPLFIFHPPHDGRSWPLLDEHKASATPLSLSLSSPLPVRHCSSLDLQIFPSIRSVSLSDLIKENTRNLDTHTHIYTYGHDDCIAFESSILSHDYETWFGWCSRERVDQILWNCSFSILWERWIIMDY